MFNTITSIALLLISGGIAFIYISPKYDEIQNLRNNSSELSAALVKAKDIDNISKSLSEKMRSFPKEDLDRLERLLPLKIDELRFINDLQGVGERNGLKIQGIAFTDVATSISPIVSGGQQQDLPRKNNSAGYVSHKVSFTVSAPYKTFIVFLKDLERSLQFAEINSISLSTTGGSSQNGKSTSLDTYGYQVEFTTYSLQ